MRRRTSVILIKTAYAMDTGKMRHIIIYPRTSETRSTSQRRRASTPSSGINFRPSMTRYFSIEVFTIRKFQLTKKLISRKNRPPLILKSSKKD
jgi:hypothetical protein